MRGLKRFPLVLAVSILSIARSQADLPASPDSVAAFAGDYTATLEGGTYASSGSIRITINKLGRGTASVKLGGEKACVIGIGMNPGSFTLLGRPVADMSIDLGAILVDNKPTFTGTVTDDGHTIPVTLYRTLQTAPTGQWTFTLNAAGPEEKAGTGAARVDARGWATGVFQIPGHKPAAFRSRVNATGLIPLHVSLGDSSIIGEAGYKTGTIVLHSASSDRTLFINGDSYNPQAPLFGTLVGEVKVDFGNTHHRLPYIPPGKLAASRIESETLTIRVNRKLGTFTGLKGTEKLIGIVNQAKSTIVGMHRGAAWFSGAFSNFSGSEGGGFVVDRVGYPSLSAGGGTGNTTPSSASGSTSGNAPSYSGIDYSDISFANIPLLVVGSNPPAVAKVTSLVPTPPATDPATGGTLLASAPSGGIATITAPVVFGNFIEWKTSGALDIAGEKTHPLILPPVATPRPSDSLPNSDTSSPSGAVVYFGTPSGFSLSIVSYSAVETVASGSTLPAAPAGSVPVPLAPLEEVSSGK